MEELKGYASFSLIDGAKNEYKVVVTVEGFQDEEARKLFAEKEKNIFFHEGKLLLIADDITLELIPDESMLTSESIERIRTNKINIWLKEKN